MSALLEVENLSKNFVTRSGLFKRRVQQAVKPVSFTLEAGQTIGFIGQNGSGKSTLARMLAGMVEPTSGEIRVNGERLEHRDYATRCKLIRMIFQDPNTSLNPRIQIGRILEGPLKRNTNMPPEARLKRVKDTLLRVGLLPETRLFLSADAGNRAKTACLLSTSLDSTTVYHRCRRSAQRLRHGNALTDHQSLFRASRRDGGIVCLCITAHRYR